MTFSVYQHWDPLKVCVVGRSYPPEFYSWITVPHVRELFEKIAIETEEDYQNIIKKLESFGVDVLRPTIPVNSFVDGKYQTPPMTPRDYIATVGNTFYENCSFDFKKSYQNVKDSSWPDCISIEEFATLPAWIQEECNKTHNFLEDQKFYSTYDHIFNYIRKQGNVIKSHQYHSALLNGAQISRIGKDLYFGTLSYNQDTTDYKQFVNQEFPNTRNHIVNTGGHSDATYCPVCPGLIISLNDVTNYADTFPGWEVVYLPGQSWQKVRPFLDLKKKNKGKWWIPGFEQDQAVIDLVETWLGHWTGYVEETVFDVNMLIVDPKNVIVFNYNKLVFDALDRYGITPHIVPFRHRYFWDGGIHCVTSDLHREGTMQDYFPERNNV
jgi:glycine amidinotransferase